MKAKGKYIGVPRTLFGHVCFANRPVARNWQISQNQTEILRTSFPPNSIPEEHIF